MSRHEKLKEKLLSLPANFTYQELARFLKGLGYIEQERGRSSGSAILFYNKELKDKILLHRPHPEKEVKTYLLKMIIEKLRNNKMI